MSDSKHSLLSALSSWTQSLENNRPLLIGYSGGSDSKALLYALCEVSCLCPLIVVHVNHSWRAQADQEQEAIEEEVKGLGLEIYTKKLENLASKEDVARNARLAFFATIAKKTQAQGVVLAHHAQDLAETVLKRILEGACLHKLYGMKPESTFGNLRVFRPLLACKKEELRGFLQERSLQWLEDSSNFDERYLRTRFRQKIFPQLEKDFGKNVQNSLCRLAKESQNLAEHVEIQKIDLKSLCLQGPFGTAIPNFSSFTNWAKMHYIQDLLEKKQLRISRVLLEQFLSWVEQKKSGVQIMLEKYILYLYKDTVFLLENRKYETLDSCLDLEKEIGEKRSGYFSWKDYFQGNIRIFAPVGDCYKLIKAPLEYKRKMAKQGIPLFLRKHSMVLRSSAGKIYSPFSSRCSCGVWVHFFWKNKGSCTKNSPETIVFDIVQKRGKAIIKGS